MAVTPQQPDIMNSDAWSAVPRAAYVHVPFCRHHCGYCNFSVVAGRDYLIQRYLEAIGREFSQIDSPIVVDTLYFGGGTPSRLEPDQLRRLMSDLATKIQLSRGGEFTMEANPSDVTPDWLTLARSLGVTRISLGAQSFRLEKLKALERDHNKQTICKAVEASQAAGLQVSLDLIFATPGEALSDWMQDLEKAVRLEPDHLSTYELTFEKGTQFWNRQAHGELISPDEDSRLAQYEATIEYLTAAGWTHYEVSSFARGGALCRHNCVYWSGRPYLAFGPGASRFVEGRRQTNHGSTLMYLQRIESGLSPVVFDERLEPVDLAREILAIGLRRIQGVAESEFRAVTGFGFESAAGAQIRMLLAAALLQMTDCRLSLTKAGLMIYDTLATEIAIGK
jgi:oxygen-independent coproporphyrinogen-3 oxidase